MTTRERIVDEALTLFARRGYSGVGVREIAGAVGIRDSSLYKHFSGKREIFDTILQEMTQRMDGLTQTLHLADESSAFAALSADELCALSRQVFLFYWKDPFAARFRRMLTIEQYGDSDASALYRKIFLEDSISYQTGLFRQLRSAGVLRPECDPALAAMNFYAPILVLIQRYDRQPEKEAEALGQVERQVREFLRLYGARPDGADQAIRA